MPGDLQIKKEEFLARQIYGIFNARKKMFPSEGITFKKIAKLHVSEMNDCCIKSEHFLKKVFSNHLKNKMIDTGIALCIDIKEIQLIFTAKQIKIAFLLRDIKKNIWTE